MPLPLGSVVDAATAQRLREAPAPGAPRAGTSGAPLVAGLPYGYEVNTRYLNREWHRTIVPRIRTCPPVDTGTTTLVDMLASATYSVGPGYEPTREWLARQFGIGRPPRMAEPLESLMRRLAYRAPCVGSAGYEWTTYLDPADTLAGRFGTVYVARLWDLDPRSISGIVVDEVEQIVAVQQSPWFSGGAGLGARTIPVGQLLYMVFRPQGVTDYDGWGLWRSIAEDATDHAELGQLLRIGARRYAVGDAKWMIDHKVARECGVNITPEWVDAETIQLAKFCRLRESGQDSFVVPKPWWREERPAVSQGYDASTLVKQRSSYEELILRQLVAEYLLVGGASGGSYSAAEVKVTRAAAVARNIVEWILGELDRQVVRPAIRMNWPDLPLDQYPRIVASGLKAKVFVQFAALLIQFAQAGLVQKTDQLEDAINEAFELPARTRSLTPDQRAFQSPVGNLKTPPPGVETT